MLPIVQAIPGGDAGSVENSKDTLVMMGNSAGVTCGLVGYALFLAIFNGTSQIVSKELSAVIRMLISTVRTVLVWGIDLLIYYAIPGGLCFLFFSSWVG